MKYKKGTFVIVPNKDRLRGKPTEYQCIFFWLCAYSNENGTCFPSRTKLASDCGITDRTIDKYIDMLISDGLIEKKKRKNKETNEYTSNLYQILFYNGVAKVVTPPSETNHPTPSEPNIPITVSNTNYTNLTNKQPEVVFSFEEEMKKLSKSNYKPNKIIHLFIVRKKWKFDNAKQWKTIMGRLIKSAQALEGYSGRDIDEAILYCDREYGNKFNWGLETVLKIIPNIANLK